MLDIIKRTYDLLINQVKWPGFFAIVAAYTLWVCQCNAQEPPKREMDAAAFIQELLPMHSDDSDDEALYESLFQLYSDPLDLNAVHYDALSATYILTETQLSSFFSYREAAGPLLSLYELQAIPDFDPETIQRLLPFVSLGTRQASLREAVRNPGQHFIMLRTGRTIEKQKGFEEADNGPSASRYQGSAWTQYIRYRNARTGAYSFGITLDKDAGEKQWRWSPRNQVFGFDYTSFHMQVLNRGRLKNLVVGDYQLQAGQGLAVGAGFSIGKGAEVIKTSYRSTLGIRPYTSAMEAQFMRGVATTVMITHEWEVTASFSRSRRDATQDLNVNGEKVNSSLPVSGYHRTEPEREKHHNLSEQNISLHLRQILRSANGQAGFVFMHTRYDSRIQKRDLPYNRYEFAGKSNYMISLHFDRRVQNFHVFGEGGFSRSRGAGGIGGVIASLGKKLDMSIQGRYYARNFHSFYGSANSESSRPINEKGIYVGFRFAPVRTLQFSGYIDRFRFPWLRYQVDAPSEGFDLYLNTLWKPNKRLNASILFHEKHKEKNEPGSTQEISPLVTTIRRTAVAQVAYEKPMRFSVKTRFQCGNFNYKNLSKSFGLAAMQDITWHWPRLELSGRFAYFNTDDYDSRQYAYEKDVLYAFSVPAYYDVGNRHYLLVKYHVSKKVKIWLRWSHTRYRDLEKVSSGLNEISGNTKSDVKAQLIVDL